MSGPVLYLGVDGGGSRTRAVIVDGHGTVLGRGLAGSSNLDDVGEDGLRTALEQSLGSALAGAGLAPDTALCAAHLGLAGVVSPQDEALVRRATAPLRFPPLLGVSHDLDTALAGASPDGTGIVLVSGTGSAAYGRNQDGHTWRAGGWGHLLADEGSGYALALAGLRAALQDFDGRGPPTLLRARAASFLGLDDLGAVMHRVYVGGLSRAELAAFAPVVLDAAQDQDWAAVRAVLEGASALSAGVVAVAQRLNLTRAQVFAAGGLLTQRPEYLAHVEAALASQLPDARPTAPPLSAELGAALLAMRRAGQPAGPEVIARMRLCAADFQPVPMSSNLCS